MNKNLLFVAAFIFIHTALSAQRKLDTYIVSGKIIEKESQQPLEYATIAFFSKVENKMIGGGITDPEGNFNIAITKGVYDISFEYFTFETLIKIDFNLDQNTCRNEYILSN